MADILNPDNQQHFSEKKPISDEKFNQIFQETAFGRPPKSITPEQCKQYSVSDKQLHSLFDSNVAPRHIIQMMKLFDLDLNKYKSHVEEKRNIKDLKNTPTQGVANTLQKAGNQIDKNLRGLKFD